MVYVLTPIVTEAHTLGKARAAGIQLSERYVACTARPEPFLIQMSMYCSIFTLEVHCCTEDLITVLMLSQESPQDAHCPTPIIESGRVDPCGRKVC